MNSPNDHRLPLPPPPQGEREGRHPHPSGEKAGARGRILAALLIVTGLMWATPAPADDPEVPEKYIKVDELKALVDSRRRVSIIDVRVKEQFDELHIKGARNIPLRELLTRLNEVPTQEPVVLY